MNPKSRSIAIAASLLLGASAVAQAQSTSGNITGTAVAGETIVVDGVGNGFHRELRIDKDGKYAIRRVPTGAYVVTRTRADGSAEEPQRIEVHVGVTVRVK